MDSTFNFNIVSKNQTISLGLDENLQLKDIAEYLCDENYIASMNIGIYSQNKQYYTENQEELLTSIGTGLGDTYLILEGNDKNNYKNNQEPNFQQSQQVQQQYQEGSDLQIVRVIILDGQSPRTMNLTLNLQIRTLNEIKQMAEQYLALDSKFAVVDIIINDVCFSGQDKLTKTLAQLNIKHNTSIEARVRYIGGFHSLKNNRLTQQI